jgi:anti-anti-sigma factor
MQVDPADFDRINESVGELVVGSAASDKWVLDLTGVDYIGSALLGLLVNLRQRVKAGGGTLVLCGVSGQVTKALQTCSLHNLFSIVDKREAAMKRASSSF